MKSLSVCYKDRPQHLSETLKECDSLPNIFILLKPFATKFMLMLALCINSLQIEQLHAMHSERRTTEFLSNDPQYYDFKVDIEAACKIFMEKHPRRMENANMLFCDDESESQTLHTCNTDL